MKYTRLTIEERERIHALVNQGMSNRDIALAINRSHTTIARELRRCKTRLEYSPSKAHAHAGRLPPSRGRKPIIDIRPEVWYEAVKKLVEDHSPEQISKTFKIEHADEPLKWISHETIYKYIYATPKGELRKVFAHHLRRKRRSRKDRSQVHEQRGRIIGAVSISNRPDEVNDRSVPGHWEGDLITHLTQRKVKIKTFHDLIAIFQVLKMLLGLLSSTTYISCQSGLEKFWFSEILACNKR
jgi:IS30 family transposase